MVIDEREADVRFKNAEDELPNASVKTADRHILVSNLKIRGRNFAILYGFYGASSQARQRFQNYSGNYINHLK